MANDEIQDIEAEFAKQEEKLKSGQSSDKVKKDYENLMNYLNELNDFMSKLEDAEEQRQ